VDFKAYYSINHEKFEKITHDACKLITLVRTIRIIGLNKELKYLFGVTLPTVGRFSLYTRKSSE
jgi:hypothetical protein